MKCVPILCTPKLFVPIPRLTVAALCFVKISYTRARQNSYASGLLPGVNNTEPILLNVEKYV